MRLVKACARSWRSAALKRSGGGKHWQPAASTPPCCTCCRMAAAGEGGGMLLSGADMAGLFEDAYSLAEAGDLPVTHFLDLLL